MSHFIGPDTAIPQFIVVSQPQPSFSAYASYGKVHGGFNLPVISQRAADDFVRIAALGAVATILTVSNRSSRY